MKRRGRKADGRSKRAVNSSTARKGASILMVGAPCGCSSGGSCQRCAPLRDNPLGIPIVSLPNLSTNAAGSGTRLLRRDPSRTATLRRSFAGELAKKYRTLLGELRKWLVQDDMLGLGEGLVTNAEWHEEQHKRDEGGRFSETSGKPDVSKMSPEEKAAYYEKLMEQMEEQHREAHPEEYQEKPKASKDIPQEVHEKAREDLDQDERSIINAAHTWEDSKPWNVSLDQLKTNPPPGVAFGKRRGTEVAYYSGGKVHLTTEFFQPPYSKYEDTRRMIIYHELGHLLADTMVRDGTAFQLHDAGVIPAQHDLGSGTAGGHGDEEAIADSFALLHTDPDWLRERYPEMMERVEDRAKALRMPLPERRRNSLAGNSRAFSQGPVTNTQFAYETNPRKVERFRAWLRGKLGSTLAGDALIETYIQQGYSKGLGRGFDDGSKAQSANRTRHRREVMGGLRQEDGRGDRANDPGRTHDKSAYLRSASYRRATVDKVKLLAGRTFSELDGVNARMATVMSRMLADGLVTGKSNEDIAQEMATEIKVAITRARAIVNTEMVRAHAEGQLDALEDLGVREVQATVEWDTAGDGKVCKLCKVLDGVVLTIQQARGLIPRHVGCRCCWGIVVEPVQAGKRVRPSVAQRRLLSKIGKSLRVETGERSNAGAADASKWPGAQLVGNSELKRLIADLSRDLRDIGL